jgi:hypothetical protein
MSDANEALVRSLPGFGPSEPSPDDAQAAPGPVAPGDTPAADAAPADDPPVKRGPQFPDLFERAMSGSHVPDLVSVNSTDGRRRVEEAAPPPVRSRATTPAMTGAEVASANGTASRSDEIGPFTGASAKRRRRWGR